MSNAQKVYSEIARLLIAIDNCKRANPQMPFENEHMASIDNLIVQNLPHGSGFDNGVRLDYDESSPNKLVFNTSFHHMDGHGYYDGWTDHKVIIRPDLAFGIDIKVTGRNRNDIKDYIHSCFADF